MTWPPKIGAPLPRAEEAIGVRRKLIAYSLDKTHERGGPKARGFEQILGITIDHVDHLEIEIRAGILVAPVSAIRDAIPTGFSCLVELPIRGIGTKSGRLITVRDRVATQQRRIAPATDYRISQALDWSERWQP